MERRFNFKIKMFGPKSKHMNVNMKTIKMGSKSQSLAF